MHSRELNQMAIGHLLGRLYPSWKMCGTLIIGNEKESDLAAGF